MILRRHFFFKSLVWDDIFSRGLSVKDIFSYMCHRA